MIYLSQFLGGLAMKTFITLFVSLFALSSQAQLNCDNGLPWGSNDGHMSIQWDGNQLTVNYHESGFSVDKEQLVLQPSQTSPGSYSLLAQNLMVSLWAEGDEYVYEYNIMLVYNSATNQVSFIATAYQDTYFFPRAETLNCQIQ
jgi:hypothetical protein